MPQEEDHGQQQAREGNDVMTDCAKNRPGHEAREQKDHGQAVFLGEFCIHGFSIGMGNVSQEKHGGAQKAGDGEKYLQRVVQ